MANPDFTIRDVLEWARTKPTDEPYDYNSNTNCAICQFIKETGHGENPAAAGTYWTEWADRPYSGYILSRHNLPDGLNGALLAGTFGALAERLEALLPAPISDTWTKADAYEHDIASVEA